MNKDKNFDCVEWVRSIRDKNYEKYKNKDIRITLLNYSKDIKGKSFKVPKAKLRKT
ncbi:MAG: hypothetical protein ACOYN6_11505 [Ignavibacteria bacterium]|jgi:hypothetical protein